MAKRAVLSDPATSFCLFSLWLAIFAVVNVLMSDDAFVDRFLTFGPSTERTPVGYVTDTWNKVIAMMMLGFATALMSNYYGRTGSAWLWTQTFTEVNPVRYSRSWVYTMGYSNRMLWYASPSLQMFVTLSIQLQFILPQLLGCFVASFLTTNWFLAKKRFTLP